MRLHNKSRTPKHIHLEVMVIESDLDEVVVLDQKEDAMLNVSEGGRAGCGMEEQFHLGKFTSTKELGIGHFHFLISVTY